MKKLIYLLVLVGAVSLTAYISAEGEFDAGENGCSPVDVVHTGTPSVTATSTQTPVPTPKITELPKVKPTKQKCNQGLPHQEGCDPGNSNNHNPSNDEDPTGRLPGTPGPRGR